MRYHAPQSVADAVSLLAAESGIAKILAGGTDLLVQMRSGFVEPDLVVDLKRIAALRAITEEDGGFRIGAGVSAAEAAEHPRLSTVWPGVVEAWELIGSTQIQGRCTLAGNLCNSSPAADTVPAMIAAGATVRIAGPTGSRDIPVEEVPAGPGKTNLAKGELVESVFLPRRPARAGDAYLRFIPRTEMDIAVVGVGANVELDDSGTCTAARYGLGAVAPTALRVDDAATAIVGSRFDDSALEKMTAAIRAACRPITDKRGTIEYRIKVAGVLAKRATLIARDRAQAAKDAAR